MDDKTIRNMLLNLPEQIKNQTLLVADMTTEVENLRLKVAEIKSKDLQSVADNPTLKNETMRKTALEVALKANTPYIEAFKELKSSEQSLNVHRVHLEYLHNLFSAYKAIAGMQATG